MNFACGLQSEPGTLSRAMHANFTCALLPYPNAMFSTWTAFQNLVFTGLREEQISRELYSVRDHPTRTSANIAIIPIRTQIFFFIYSLLISFFFFCCAIYRMHGYIYSIVGVFICCKCACVRLSRDEEKAIPKDGVANLLFQFFFSF